MRNLLSTLLAGLLFVTMPTQAVPAVSIPNVLVFTGTTGFRHDSIPTAIRVLTTQADRYKVHFEFTEDPDKFNNDTLKTFDAVMFVSATGTGILDEARQAAFKTFLQSGGVYVGVHAASSCLENTTFYRQEVGAIFDYHPELQQATFIPLNTTHPAMTMIPAKWRYEEEVYYFESDPRDVGAEVLMTVDETSYWSELSRGPASGRSRGRALMRWEIKNKHADPNASSGKFNMGKPHPIAWCQFAGAGANPVLPDTPGAGRSFYTSLGHLNSTWEDDVFISHVMNGLMWALEGGTTKAYRDDALVGNASRSGNGTTTAGSAGVSAKPSAESGSASQPTGSSLNSTTSSSSPSSQAAQSNLSLIAPLAAAAIAVAAAALSS